MGTTRTIYGVVENAAPGSSKPWLARYSNGQTSQKYYAQQGEARADVQSHAGHGAPLTWTLDTQPNCPEQWVGEFVVTT